jgi:hypothetical protein
MMYQICGTRPRLADTPESREYRYPEVIQENPSGNALRKIGLTRNNFERWCWQREQEIIWGLAVLLRLSPQDTEDLWALSKKEAGLTEISDLLKQVEELRDGYKEVWRRLDILERKLKELSEKTDRGPDPRHWSPDPHDGGYRL